MHYKDHTEHYIIDGEYYDYFAFDKFMVEGKIIDNFFNLIIDKPTSLILISKK